MAAKNLRILHDGMGWPVGAVVPTAAFPNGHDGHLALGAVQETDLPATHGDDLPEAPPPGSDLAAENARLRTELANQKGAVAGLAEDLKATRKKNEELAAENQKLWSELDAATKAAQARSAADRQAKLDAGPSPPAAPAG